MLVTSVAGSGVPIAQEDSVATRAAAATTQRFMGDSKVVGGAPCERPGQCAQPSHGPAAKATVPLVKPSIGLEPMTPSLPWKCSTN